MAHWGLYRDWDKDWDVDMDWDRDSDWDGDVDSDLIDIGIGTGIQLVIK